MPANNMALAAEALKIYYLPGLQYQANTANPVLAVIDRDSESVVGKEIHMALRYGRQGGTGNRADDGDLPTSNPRKTKQAAWETKNIFARIQISDKTIKASRGSLGAFTSLLEADLEDAMTDVKNMLSREVFGDGIGKMALIKSASYAAGVLTLGVDSTQYIAEGMYLDIIDVSQTPDAVLTNGSGLEVTEVDEEASPNATVKVKVGSDISASIQVDNDFLVQSGNHNLELTGFGAVFTKDNTLYGIDRSTNKWFNPTILPIDGEVSEVALQKIDDEADRKAGGKIGFYATTYGVRRAYQNLLIASKQITQVMELEGGYSELTYNGRPFTADKHAPAKTLYALDRSTWRMYEMGDWDWLDRDGAVLSRVSGKPIWEATLARYCDLGCKLPAGNVKATGLNER